ncbi:MAG: hypothetical protein R6V58_09555 [Planctomycetota bacterium]
MSTEPVNRTAWVAGGLAAVLVTTWLFWSGQAGRMTGPDEAEAVTRPADGIYRPARDSEVAVSLCVANGGRTVRTATVSGEYVGENGTDRFAVVLAGLGEIEAGRLSGSGDAWRIAGHFVNRRQATGSLWRTDPDAEPRLVGRWSAHWVRPPGR